MFIGSTDKERPDDFVIIEKDDNPSHIIQFMEEKNVYNLIIDANVCDISIFDNIQFYPIFNLAQIVHLANIDLKKSDYIYQFNKSKRLEIKNCKFSGKEKLNWENLNELEELFTIYSKRFENLFNHPRLSTIFIENFTEKGYEFPENLVLKSLSIEKSVECQWNTLSNFKNLTSLYLVNIPSIVNVLWILDLKKLEDIEFTSCKKIENYVDIISEISSLKSIWLAYMGGIESLKPLSKLTNLKELTIESGGKLLDKDVLFLNNMNGLEYSIEMSNLFIGNEVE